MSTPRHLLDMDDLTANELALVLDLAERAEFPAVLASQGVGLLFEKPSARTRNSMEVAVVQLGGHPVSMRGEEVGIGARETVEDLTRTLASYHRVIGARVFDHATVERMSDVSPVPVINLLSDQAHPLQTLADLLTMRQRFKNLAGLTVAWVGDGNNVCNSLMIGAALARMHVRVATPPGFEPSALAVEKARDAGGRILLTNDPAEATGVADAICTDVWASMGQEGEADSRRAAFADYAVTAELMDKANPGAVFLHCLPAHRGEEVAAEVIDGPSSLVWPQAANRLHAARGLLLWLLGTR
ncbi:MAG: ornithine carbamoyltransferase [Actinomycetota bacterium]